MRCRRVTDGGVVGDSCSRGPASEADAPLGLGSEFEVVEELIGEGAVEALCLSVGLRPARSGAPMHDPPLGPAPQRRCRSRSSHCANTPTPHCSAPAASGSRSPQHSWSPPATTRPPAQRSVVRRAMRRQSHQSRLRTHRALPPQPRRQPPHGQRPGRITMVRPFADDHPIDYAKCRNAQCKTHRRDPAPSLVPHSTRDLPILTDPPAVSRLRVCRCGSPGMTY